MNMIYMECDFFKYCPSCKYGDQDEKMDPCNDCLAEPMNAESEKPVYWKEKGK